VRRLAKRAFDVCASEPLHALTFADAAIAVAEALPQDHYPPNALHDLRGRAWKERANALNRLGEPAAALDALQHAEREYQKVTSNTLGLGNVALVRATAYYYLEMWKQIVDLARHVFKTFTEAGMLTSALTALGYIRMAAAEQRLTREAVREVRAFVRRVERQPALLFIPPPDRPL
jgi:tetratricopeptide (TPR) repeat protein